MKNYEQPIGPDWWGRLMALGSLLVAGAALWYAKIELPRAVASRPADAEVSKEVGELTDQLQQKLEESASQSGRVEGMLSKMEALHAEITQLAGEVEENMDQLAVSSRTPVVEATKLATDTSIPADEASELADVSTDDLLSPLSSSAEAARLAPTDLLAPPDDDEPSPVMDDAPDVTPVVVAKPPMTEDNLTAAAARLLVVHTTMRPLQGDDKSEVTVTLKNDGDGPAVIDRVSFEPLEIIDGVPIERVVQSIGDSNPWRLVCLFDPAENLSTDPGAEGRYVHRLSKPFTIPVGREVNVVVGIKKSAHIGYALRGHLKLEFIDGESLLVENAGIAFMGRPQP